MSTAATAPVYARPDLPAPRATSAPTATGGPTASVRHDGVGLCVRLAHADADLLTWLPRRLREPLRQGQVQRRPHRQRPVHGDRPRKHDEQCAFPLLLMSCVTPADIASFSSDSLLLPQRPMLQLGLVRDLLDLRLLVRLGLTQHHLDPPLLLGLLPPVLHLRERLHLVQRRVHLVRAVRDGVLKRRDGDGVRWRVRGRARPVCRQQRPERQGQRVLRLELLGHELVVLLAVRDPFPPWMHSHLRIADARCLPLALRCSPTCGGSCSGASSTDCLNCEPGKGLLGGQCVDVDSAKGTCDAASAGYKKTQGFWMNSALEACDGESLAAPLPIAARAHPRRLTPLRARTPQPARPSRPPAPYPTTRATRPARMCARRRASPATCSRSTASASRRARTASSATATRPSATVRPTSPVLPYDALG